MPTDQHVTHDVLLRAGVTLIEYLVNTAALRAPRTLLCAAPLKIPTPTARRHACSRSRASPSDLRHGRNAGIRSPKAGIHASAQTSEDVDARHKAAGDRPPSID